MAAGRSSRHAKQLLGAAVALRLTRGTTMELAGAAAVGALFAILGPFGTFSQAPLAERLVYWVGLLLAAYMVYWPACRAADALARKRSWPPAAAWSGALLAATAPMTLVVWLASFRHTPRPWPTPELYLDLYPSVLVVGAAMAALLALLQRTLAATPRPAEGLEGVGGAAAPSPSSPAFLSRLPSQLGRDLLALQMEDHYVRAHTASGSALVLMRMSDAVEQLRGLEGLRVHRSWWVARSAVAGVEREGRKVRLVLRNGLSVPVPRNRAAELKTAGWASSSI